MKTTGSLQIKKDKYYAVIRITDDTGNSQQKWKSTGISVTGSNKRESAANRRAAEIKVQEYIDYFTKLEHSTSPDAFVSWLDEWLARKKTRVRTVTWEAYQGYIDKHIRPYFAPMELKIQDVTPRHIQQYIDHKYSSGMKAVSIKKHIVVLHGVFREAVRFNIIPFDPCDRVEMPRIEKFRGKAYTQAEANNMLLMIQDEDIYPAVILGLLLGLRRSEVLGLRWCDIDFEHDIVHIRNTVVKLKTIVEAEQTKSESSRRDLYLMPSLKQYLISLRAKQDEAKMLLGAAYEDTGHVVCWPDGRQFHPDYLTRRFRNVLRKTGLPEIRFHELRHTAGSILLSLGQSPKQVQEYLGHEDVQTTLNIYTHLTEDDRKDSAKILTNALNFPRPSFESKSYDFSEHIPSLQS